MGWEFAVPVRAGYGWLGMTNTNAGWLTDGG